MSPGPFAPHDRPKKKYTARSYSRSTLRPPKRYSARVPRTTVTTMSIATPLQGGKASTITAAPWPPPMQGAEPEALLRAAQSVQQMDRDAGPGRGERVADGDRAAVHVGFGAVEPELSLDREILRRERLVHFHQVHLLELHPRLLQCLARRGRRPDPHVLGLDSDHRPGDEAAERLQAVRLRVVRARNHGCGGAVHDSGGVPRGDEPVLPEIRLEGEQHLERRVGPHVLVGAIFGRLTLLSLHRHRHYLVLEHACVPGLLGALLGRERHLVYFLPSQLVFLGEALGGLGHGQAALRVFERLPEEVLERGRRPQPHAPPRAAHHVPGLARRLRAAGEPPRRSTPKTELSASGERFEPRAAQPVDGDGRDLDRETCLEPDVTGAVDRVGGRLEGVAGDAVAHPGGGDARGPQPALPGDGRGARRGGGLPRAAVARGAGPGRPA